MVEGFLEEMEMANERERRRTWREFQLVGFGGFGIEEDWFDEEEQEKEEESDEDGWNQENHVVVWCDMVWWRTSWVIIYRRQMVIES